MIQSAGHEAHDHSLMSQVVYMDSVTAAAVAHAACCFCTCAMHYCSRFLAALPILPGGSHKWPLLNCLTTLFSASHVLSSQGSQGHPIGVILRRGSQPGAACLPNRIPGFPDLDLFAQTNTL